MRSTFARLSTASVALALCALAPATAQATTVSYPDFSNTSGLTFVGDAATTTTSDGAVLRLTSAKAYEASAVYSSTPITLGANDIFSSTFQFRFTNPGGIDPADGITLSLSASPKGLGHNGGGLGYKGVGHSIAIEYDTFYNGSPDPNDNHVAVDENGVLTNAYAATPYGATKCRFSTAAGCMSNGDLWTTTVAYDGLDLIVTVQDGMMTPETLIDAPVNIAALLGTNVAYVGLTGGTGAGYENQDIKNFAYSNTLALVSGAPEPSTWAMMLLGVGGIGLAVRGSKRNRRVRRAQGAAA